MAKIEKIIGREVIDSRGTHTVQAMVLCEGGAIGSAMVPSGASTGIHEAVELRDGEEKRYFGKGTKQAVGHVNVEIQAALVGQDTANQTKLDRRMMELDGTPNKGKLGANAILAVSLACARAEAASHVLPVGAKDFQTALRMGVEIHHALKELLLKEGFRTEVGDEGGFAPKLKSSEDAFVLMIHAIEQAGYIPGVDVYLGIDAAASEFYDAEQKGYMLDGALLHANDLAFRFKQWRERYPIISIEDPFEQDQWGDWIQFVENNGNAVQIVGDDFYVTNTTRIKEGIAKHATNSVLIKPNQIGSLTDTLQKFLEHQTPHYERAAEGVTFAPPRQNVTF